MTEENGQSRRRRQAVTASESTAAFEQPEEEAAVITSLRPQSLAEYGHAGQRVVVENLGIAIEAARKREEPLDHVLLHGPPGLGKTTLAHGIANEMTTTLIGTSGPALERQGDLMGILSNLEVGSVLFVDEIHRLPRAVEEFLYSAMEDFALDIIIGKGPSAKALRLNLPKFTLIGATTLLSRMTSPLRDRFGVIHKLEFYEDASMREIVRQKARVLAVPVDEAGLEEIGTRARGTPLPRDADRLEFLLQPSDADPEGDAAVAQPVKRRDHFREHHRIMLGHQANPRGEPNPAGAGGGERQRRKWIVYRNVGRR